MRGRVRPGTGQIDHRGHRPVPAVVRRLPDVLVDPQGDDPFQPARVVQSPDRLGLDRVPAGVPVHPQVACQGRHGGVVVSQRVGRPRDRPGRQLGPPADQVVGLAERLDRAPGVGATPDPLAPPDHHRRPERRGVMGPVDPAPVTDRDHPADPAPRDQLVGLDRDHQPPGPVMADVDDVQAGGIEHLISASAPRRADAASTLRHVGVSVERTAWSLPVLEAPTPPSPDRHAPRPRRPHPRSTPKSRQSAEGCLAASVQLRARLPHPDRVRTTLDRAIRPRLTTTHELVTRP